MGVYRRRTDTKNDRVSYEFRRRLIRESGGYCQNCGAISRLTADHLIPVSVFRYTCGTDKLDIHRDNTTVLCKDCNKIKNANILPKEELMKIAIDKDKFSKWYDSVEVYIEEYKRLVSDIVRVQGNMCKHCKQPISSEDDINLRRISSEQPVNFDNIAAIHRHCNPDFSENKAQLELERRVVDG